MSKPRMTTELFVEKAHRKHGHAYDYNETVYTHSHANVNILCPQHGVFEQVAGRHLEGHGCKLCSIEIKRSTYCLNPETFITRAQAIHGTEYDYSNTQYTRAINRVTISCRIHGPFIILPQNHLAGSGCSKCYSRSTSNQERKWLDNQNIPKSCRNIPLIINDRRYVVDGFDSTTNTIYEYYGDYWHGNPKTHSAMDYNSHLRVTFGELLQRTVEREQRLRKAGYNLVTRWQTE